MEKKSGTILVTDDQAGVRKLLYEVFSRDGFTVLTAADGQEALRVLQTEVPDLILLDVKMPGLGGLETLRQMRARDLDTCVILMTAYGETEVVAEAMKLGAVKHIAKPFDLNQLRQTVKELVHDGKPCQ